MDKAAYVEVRVPDRERISPERMSPLVRAFLGEIGRSGVSDTAFKLALLMVPMLSFGSWQTVFLHDIAKRAGTSRGETYVAVSELVRAGALARRQSGFAARKTQSFRLREQFQAGNSKRSSNAQYEDTSYSPQSHIGAVCVRDHP
ncbi:MAG TPA: hypothetical protein VJS30_31515 [Paraburkholderia sp.]|nr:hypothetical protein [Paraburkholderia sp.]